ncbi:MAG: ATP-binding cassette domain-containing protein [Alphaproteobacteria bacterium]|nr:ATP-binding cassette domain-containing protein [Alphaproteobacteria bacterium]MBF0250126.1 ATP-binding cassette domain-containing protein [Alphaproteobacteria bacterium]
MGELFRRLKSYPLASAELLVASLFANVLALASPLFVMQVLNRYVSHGVDSTLFTLTAGVVTAIVFEVGFRQIRMTIANALCQPFDHQYATATFEALAGARTDAMGQIPSGQKREAAQAPDAIQQAFAAPNLVAYLDLPFALVFLLALALLNPLLAAIALLFMVIVLLLGWTSYKGLEAPTQDLQGRMAERQGVIDTVVSDPDTVRVFSTRKSLRLRWSRLQTLLNGARAAVTARQGMGQNLTQGVQALLSAGIITVGAMMVVSGDMNVGLLIGANILAARAVAPLIRMTQLAPALAKAHAARQTIEGLVRIPRERTDGSALGKYRGALQFSDVAFAYPGHPTPLFESLSLKLEPGALFVVSGANGSGKTTLARLLAGLVQPVRGQILVDGVDLAQVAPEWWRRQIVYLPQEPGFFAGSVRENLMAYVPELDESSLNAVIREAGLEAFFAASQQGFDMQLQPGGRNLPLGIRRRLALARALSSEGRLVILDEPTEGLDGEGAQQVGRVMNALKQRGCTIIALSHDPNIIQGAPHILDLNAKPVPRLLQTQPRAKEGA